jgi:hypothetical protein
VHNILVQEVSSDNFKVIVSQKSITEHDVTASKDFLKQFIKYNISPENIVKHSFEFLLDREPNTSILRKFDITVISNYFPEYTETVKEYF